MPRIISRNEWDAAPSKGPLDRWTVGTPNGWVVHWAGVPIPTKNHTRCADDVRGDQRYHQNGEFLDVAYSFLVCQHGDIYEGRGFDYRSAAQGSGGNGRYLAVQYHGGPGTPFTPEGRRAIRWLIRIAGPVGARDRVITHRAVPGVRTACPGDDIARWVDAGMPVDNPTPPPPPTLRPILSIGSRGNDVFALQRALNRVLKANLVTDSVFGSQTDRVVRIFQQWSTDQGRPLAVDGIVGVATWRALAALGAI